VLEVVRELDLGAIEGAIQQKDPRGERPYAPKMMTSLLLYAYCAGVFSSRKIERATYEDVAFRVIAGGSQPHFTTVNAFRLAHREALAGLFVQVLRMCVRAGLRTMGHVSLDGSKVQANASKHKAMSYGRMKDDEKRLAGEIEALLRRAEETDAKEDAEFGRDKRGDELPAELQRREDRVRRIREVKAELEKEAAEARAATLRANAEELRKIVADPAPSPKSRKAAATLAAKSDQRANELAPRDDDDDDHGAGGSVQLSLHRVPATPDGKPKNNAQRNFTDGDSRIMIRNGVFMQAYNAQAAVSEDRSSWRTASRTTAPTPSTSCLCSNASAKTAGRCRPFSPQTTAISPKRTSITARKAASTRTLRCGRRMHSPRTFLRQRRRRTCASRCN
jgi:transposase